jgi:uncharacterized protein YgiM (DUF1202 family)
LLNVRSAPDPGSAVIGQVAENAELEITGNADGGWWPVSLGQDGTERTGWVSGEHLQGIPESGYDMVRDKLTEFVP